MTTERVAKFSDGPLDGIEFPVPNELDMIVLIFRDRAMRYEVDQEMLMTVQEDNQEPHCQQTYRLVETRDVDSFDEDLIFELEGGDE